MIEKSDKPSYQPWNDDHFLADYRVRGMTAVQRWMYRSLLQAAFFHTTRPFLPSDDNDLWILAGCESIDQWQANKAVVLKCFVVAEHDKTLLAQKRLLTDWKRLETNRLKMADLGRKSAAVQRALRDRSTESEQVRVRESKSESKEKLSPPDGVGDLEDYVPPDGETDDLSSQGCVDGYKASLEEALEQVWQHYLTAMDKNPKLNTFTATRKKKGLARLRECCTKTDNLENAGKLMKLAIDKLAASDFHMGRDPKTSGKKYNDWENHVFRSYEQMETWWGR